MALCPVCNKSGEKGDYCSLCSRYMIDETQVEKSRKYENNLLGCTIGDRYIAESILGEGGVGLVYKATTKVIGRPVALKILKDDYMTDETLKERFSREAQVIASMSHKNIVTLYDAGYDATHDLLYMAIEFLDGKSLYEYMKRPISVKEILKIFIDICAGLSVAHKLGIIHRDLKPDNILMVRDREAREDERGEAILIPKILDFGFARLQNASKKLTQVGIAFGTPHYMSPEQAMGLIDITPAADVYALGIMLYEALSGNFPFKGNSAMEVMTKHVNEAPPPLKFKTGLDAPASLSKIVSKCLKKDPKSRYRDGGELFEALSELYRNTGFDPGADLRHAKTMRANRPAVKNWTNTNRLIIIFALLPLFLLTIILLIILAFI